MRNLKYFTFERNKYFYGKLLSVDDFEAEQRYMNDKRRIINRFVHGTGVVCGMNVVPVDDITISVETGLALDFAGREIMIATPVTKKLSMIDGFEDYTEEDESSSFLYLCVEYMESEKEPVHSLVGSQGGSGQKVEYNKYEEGFHLFLTKQEPEDESSFTESLYEKTKTIYWKDGVRIRQTVPRYVKENQEFRMRVSVENLGQTKPVSFHYELKTSCIQGQDTVTVTFDEEEYKKSKYYEFEIPLKAGAVTEAEAVLEVKEGSFGLEIGHVPVKAQAAGRSSLRIISGNVKQKIMDTYYRTAMEEIERNTYQQSIYLARISVIRAGATYIIDSVEGMPFQQYLYNNTLASAMNRLNIREEEETPVSTEMVVSGRQHTAQETEPGMRIATGTAVLNLGIGANAGQKFFSREITHGLGLGEVSIILGRVAGSEEESVLFGEAGIFEDSRERLNVKLAAKVNVERGTFVIGAQFLENTSERSLRVRWTAVRDAQEVQKEKEETVMKVKPDMKNLYIRETQYFEAVIGQETESRIKWSVLEPDGGVIDENGMYTAPNKPGVYEIMAESKDYPELKASTFVVVRDIKALKG